MCVHSDIKIKWQTALTEFPVPERVNLLIKIRLSLAPAGGFTSVMEVLSVLMTV